MGRIYRRAALSIADATTITRATPLPRGAGRASVRREQGQSAVVACSAREPLRLLPMRGRADVAWVTMTTFGAGLHDGDHVSLSLDVGEGASLLLSTLASTKVMRAISGEGSSQRIDARVAPGGLLALLPDHVACFEGARLLQRTIVQLSPGASLFSLEWSSAGRVGREPRWSAQLIDSGLTVREGDRPVVVERLLLDRDEPGPPPAQRLGRFDVFGSLFALGPHASLIAPTARALAASSRHDGSPSRLVDSPLAGGLAVRFASVSADHALSLVRSLVRPLTSLLGADPFRGRS